MARISVDFTARSQMGAALADIAKVRASLAALAVDMQTLGKTNMPEMRNLEKDFLKNVNALKQFETMQVRTRTSTQKLTDNIIKQKIAMKDMASVRNNLRALAVEQDRLARSQALVTERMRDGRIAGTLIQPMGELADKTRLARIEQGILGQAMMSAGQQAIKAGKNMQWSGRQLMSGFSAPIGLAAGAAAKFAYDIDASMVRLTKVYGDLSGASAEELDKVRKDTMMTAKAVARDFGLAGTETVRLAADFAAAGKSGEELQRSTYETQRISTLGELDRQKAMQSTITMQTVFGISTEQLADKFNFLNAVENSTNTTLQDLTDVIPRTAGVIKDLGGTLEDSAIFTVAFKEAGIDAVQGANALRSSLGAIVAPSGVASKKLQALGINMAELVEKNRPEKGGSLMKLLQDLGQAMSSLGSVERQQAMSVLFGRYQFNKMGGLLKGLTENANDMSTQVGKAFSLTQASTEELAGVADRELKQMSESLSGRLVRALREAQIEFAEFGRPILAMGVEIMEFINGFVGVLNSMPKPLKIIAGLVAGGLFVAGPIIYIIGLFKNMYGQLFRLAGIMLRTKGASKEMLTPQGVFATQAESQVIPAIKHETTAFAMLEQQIQRTQASLASLNAEQLATSTSGLSAGRLAGRERYPKGTKNAKGDSIAGALMPIRKSPTMQPVVPENSKMLPIVARESTVEECKLSGA
jgi:TP901 family phage tail tape measure protein